MMILCYQCTEHANGTEIKINTVKPHQIRALERVCSQEELKKRKKIVKSVFGFMKRFNNIIKW